MSELNTPHPQNHGLSLSSLTRLSPPRGRVSTRNEAADSAPLSFPVTKTVGLGCGQSPGDFFPQGVKAKGGLKQGPSQGDLSVPPQWSPKLLRREVGEVFGPQALRNLGQRNTNDHFLLTLTRQEVSRSGKYRLPSPPFPCCVTKCAAKPLNTQLVDSEGGSSVVLADSVGPLSGLCTGS